MQKIERIRHEALIVFRKSTDFGWPICFVMDEVRDLFRDNGLLVPRDILAFVSNGKVSDDDITSLSSPLSKNWLNGTV